VIQSISPTESALSQEEPVKGSFLYIREIAVNKFSQRPLRVPRRALRRVIGPLQTFINTEVSSGVVLLLGAGAALIWANSPWDDAYHDLFATRMAVDAGLFHIEADLHDWINEGLMAFFFYVAGLEIKRELLRGELAGRDRALLPIVAAAGGMIVPALIYTAINAGTETGRGWGIPMATDIAFALGVLALLGRRIPAQLRIFLLALAIADDMGAIAVIAVFYSSDLQLDSLALAAALLVLICAMQATGVRALAFYVLVALAVWVAVHSSGIHATIAGVALGLLTPLEPLARPGLAARLLDWLRGHDSHRVLETNGEAPLERMERSLHPFTSFLVVPIFALANAGISLDPTVIRGTADETVTLGVAAGLVAGKPIGICLFSWLVVRSGLASLPSGVRWPQMIGAGTLGGIGFTVSLFIDELAFGGRGLEVDGKLGILAGSVIAGALGFAVLWFTHAPPEQDVEATGR
jgi:NhaA family Na+:H+ antiporter